MGTYRPHLLGLAVALALTGCAASGGNPEPMSKPSSSPATGTAADCTKSIQLVRITAVNAASSPQTIQLDPPRACVAAGSALVIWTFANVSGYVFGAGAVSVKLNQPPGLIAGVPSRDGSKYFAIFDSSDSASWNYNLAFKSVDGRQTWTCDPTIANFTVDLTKIATAATFQCNVAVTP